MVDLDIRRIVAGLSLLAGALGLAAPFLGGQGLSYFGRVCHAEETSSGQCSGSQPLKGRPAVLAVLSRLEMSSYLSVSYFALNLHVYPSSLTPGGFDYMSMALEPQLSLLDYHEKAVHL